MTLIRVDEVRASIIMAILSNATIMAELDDVTEVRELNWKGTEFSYPNIRVEIQRVPPDPNRNCGQSFIGSIFAFSENSSSTQADRIAGIIADEYDDKSLSSNGIFFTNFSVVPVGAIAQDERTWRGEVQVESMIQRL